VPGERVISDQCAAGAPTRKTTQWYCNEHMLAPMFKYLFTAPSARRLTTRGRTARRWWARRVEFAGFRRVHFWSLAFTEGKDFVQLAQPASDVFDEFASIASTPPAGPSTDPAAGGGDGNVENLCEECADDDDDRRASSWEGRQRTRGRARHGVRTTGVLQGAAQNPDTEEAADSVESAPPVLVPRIPCSFRLTRLTHTPQVGVLRTSESQRAMWRTAKEKTSTSTRRPQSHGVQQRGEVRHERVERQRRDVYACLFGRGPGCEPPPARFGGGGAVRGVRGSCG